MGDMYIAMIAVSGTIAFFSVPIVWLLTNHQRKMAAIIHGAQKDQSAAQNESLANEVRELKQLVYQQALAVDSLATEVRSSRLEKTSEQALPNRLS